MLTAYALVPFGSFFIGKSSLSKGIMTKKYSIVNIHPTLVAFFYSTSFLNLCLNIIISTITINTSTLAKLLP